MNKVVQSPHRERVTQRERDANNFQWYKDKAHLINSSAYGSNFYMGYGGVTDYKRKKVNYDLFNNIINKADFEYVCQPFGSQTGDLPAELTNRDIVSGKIKVLLGMEMKMPFSWNVIATNESATTRKEQEEFGRIKDFVISEIMRPIQEQITAQAQAEAQGRQLTPEEQQTVQQQIAAQIESQTPDEVRRYMVREHQDPAEVQMQQILQYLIWKERIPDKFNKGFKHSALSGEEIYRVDIINGEPVLVVVNPLSFDYDLSSDLDYINEGEWARCEYKMSPSAVISQFGTELKDHEIDKIYQFQDMWGSPTSEDFNFSFDGTDNASTVPVMHIVWKSLRKVGFLDYVDVNGRLQMKIVDENYRINKDQGDLAIDWEWIPEAHECWKILDDIFCFCRPVPGQHRDLDNLWKCDLPYYGAAVDNLNSPITSPMDRMKSYQYYYNIVLYRIELLMASDKGKILAANINSIPKSAGIDVAKFMYFMEANKIAFLNPNEEGNRNAGDVTNMVKEIDMSLASDIFKYIQIAEFIEERCGSTIGVTKPMEGAVGPNDAVSNTRQNLIQSSHIIQPYFELHNNVKGQVLQALCDKAKVAYSVGKPRKLNYILDDMSKQMLTINQDLLNDNTYGLFISNSSKAEDAKQAVTALAQAALQTQQADLSDIIKVIRSENVNEAEELLEVARARKAAELQESQKLAAESQERIAARADKLKRDEWAHEKDLVITKEEERRKTVIQQQTILSLGFNENKDMDNDGTPDVLEVAKHGVDAEIRRRELDIEERRLDHDIQNDAAKNKLEEEKNDILKKKNVAPRK